MRQRSGTTIVLVTWRHVSRVTRHVPPREKFEKICNTATAQTGGGRVPKLGTRGDLDTRYPPPQNFLTPQI